MLKNKYVQIGIVIIIVIGALVFIANDFYNKDTSSKNESEAVATTTTTSIGNGVEIEGTGDYTVNFIDSEEIIDIESPSLDKSIVISALLDAEAKAILTNNIEELIEQLRVSSDRVDLWLKLGLYYKIAGDYEGAIEAWDYVSKVGPDSVNYIAYQNLGDLYHYYLKDFPKAEQNLRIAIENDKLNTRTYAMLHELYKYSYKQNTTLVTDVLFEGLVENPNNTDLLITLAAYYKEVGNSINAKKYYEQARDEAQKLGNTQLVELLNEEINKL
jgi:tetratricopeptide (TPR) repeat protein